MSKKTSLILLYLIIGICTSVQAQYGLRLMHIKPSLEYGYVFKPTIGVEVTYLKIRENTMIHGSIGFFSLDTRKDVFPTFTIGGDNPNGGTGFHVGTDEWHFYRVIPMSMGISHRLKDEDTSPVIGVDFILNFTRYDRTTKTLLIESSTLGGSAEPYIYPHIGFHRRLIDKVDLFFTFGRAMGVNEDLQYQAFWKTALEANLEF